MSSHIKRTVEPANADKSRTHEHIKRKNKELADVETKLKIANKEYEPYKAQDELNRIHELFPAIKEKLRIADFCQKIGLAFESIKSLIAGNILTANKFSFFSSGHNQKFTAADVKLKIEKEPDNPNKLRLNLNGMDILDWFREKYKEVQRNIEVKVKQEPQRNKRFSL